MTRFVLSFFGGIFTFVTMGAAMVALAVAGVFWMFGRDLPSHESLSQYQPPTISRIYSGEGQIIDEFARERRLFVPADNIPDLVKEAFISAEDKNFYSHKGYDPRGMVAAARDAVVSRGQNLRGASTITQQVMKNFLLSGDRQAERKIKEIILASRLEDTLDKEKILELYLNEIFLGQNAYGVTAAAQTYFNKSLQELDAGEAAYLASLPKSPSNRHPVRDYDTAVYWRNNTLREMNENGFIDDATYDVARAEPLKSVQNGDFKSYRTSLPSRDYFTDEIRRQLTRDFGEGEFFTGGYTVRATIDAEMQPVAADALRRQLERYDREQGIWRGTGETIDPILIDDEPKWRAALAEVKVARDIDLENPWAVAVVRRVQEQQLILGIEGWQPGMPEPVVPRSDIRWMKGDFFANFKPGDVIHVRTVTDDSSGAFLRWSVRQVPEIQGAFVAMDVNTGRVIAMQGGFSYQHSVYNRATQAKRQPGSAFKPFVYAAALDSGYNPATIVVDAPIEIDTPQGLWRPKNASNRFYGPTPLRTGIEQQCPCVTRITQGRFASLVGGRAERPTSRRQSVSPSFAFTRPALAF